MIKINKPYIQEENGYARLCSKIEVDSDVWDIWYEVEACNKQYLCYEKADAFLIGLLPFAMAFNHNIKVIDCPISEKIYWNLINTFIPALSKYSNYYKFIEIDNKILFAIDYIYKIFSGDSFSALRRFSIWLTASIHLFLNSLKLIFFPLL